MPDQLLWIDDLIKALFIDVSGRERCFLQSQAPIIGHMGDRGGLVIRATTAAPAAVLTGSLA
jgi:hypothetical protein